MQNIGYIGQLHPAIQHDLELQDTYMMEIEWLPLVEHATFAIPYQALPKYPSIGRDMAFVIDHTIGASEVVNKVKESAGSLLESIEVFDVYTDQRLGEDKKSIAFKLVFRHLERTLTDEEVSAIHDRIVQTLSDSFNAQLRTL